MRRVRLLLIDLVLIASATVTALMLRDNFVYSDAHVQALIPYLIFTLAAACLFLPAFGISRSVWRFSAFPDFIRLFGLCVVVVTSAVVANFAYNRLADIARTLPIIQFALMLSALIGARLMMRIRYLARTRTARFLQNTALEGASTVLVVGLTPLTDLYLQSVSEFAGDRVRIAGILGRKESHTGRTIHQHKVLGTPQQVERILRELETHGVNVDRIVVTTPLEKLPPEAHQELLKIANSTNIKLDLLDQQLGLAPSSHGLQKEAGSLSQDDGAVRFSIPFGAFEAVTTRPYWRLKRCFDVFAAMCLLVLTAPIMLLVSVAVAGNLGFPILFWQNRPGHCGKPFRLHKFRTMSPAHDAFGRKTSDSDRVSSAGWLLRRTRLDELPQLFNILAGDMSFVGPRPLLLADQLESHGVRLSVRPGLTGWAQVKGGRDVNPDDKTAMDLWYVQNASLLLDLKIILATIPMVVFGERIDRRAIQGSWQALHERGFCSASFLSAVPEAE